MFTKDTEINTEATQEEKNTAQIFEFKNYRTRKAAEEELLSYLAWTLKHDFDPHQIYDDPVEMFRAELAKANGEVDEKEEDVSSVA